MYILHIVTVTIAIILMTLTSFLFPAATKVNGWFKNQRTAIGKLYKTKSGQAPQALTIRKKWQLASFAFLKDHIFPRSYTKDTAVVSLLTCTFFLHLQLEIFHVSKGEVIHDGFNVLIVVLLLPDL